MVSEERKQYMKEYYAAHREELMAKMKEKYAANPERSKKYREDNKERLNAASREYREKNADKVKDINKKWYWENREQKLAANKLYRQVNRERLEALRIERTYGLNAADWKALQEKQAGHCAICGKIPKNLFVDHDHATGKVRGLLCQNCNTFIGHANEDLVILQQSQVYLSQHS